MSNLFGINTPFIVLGTYAAAVSGSGMYNQLSMAGDMSEEIHARRDVQDLGVQTTDVYDENLDTYSGMVDDVGGLEMEVPDDLEVPTETSTDTPAAGEMEESPSNPFLMSPDSASNDNKSADDDKKDKEKK